MNHNNQNIDNMNGFLDWFYNRVKSIHTISNEQFINVQEKLSN